MLIGVLSSCAEEKEPSLDKYQWKKRIILTHPADAQTWGEQLKSARRYHAKMTDRDLVMFRLDAEMQTFTKSQRTALMKKYKLTKGTHVLIGKDGTEKGRQTGKLDIEKWFKLIDTMPMRKQEMNR